MVKAHSIAGRKTFPDGSPRQEDAYYISPLTERGQLILVADGVGGHSGGDWASNYVIQHFKESFMSEYTDLEKPDEYLRHSALIVASNVYETGSTTPAYKNCGTTLTGFYLKDSEAYTINIGDSRVYQYNALGELILLTKDHSHIQRLLDEGVISEKEVATHPLRNKMFSAIGMPPDKIQIDIRGPLDIGRNSLLLACSDGIHDALADESIRMIMMANENPESLPKILVDTAYNAGITDNITACVWWG